MTLSTKKFAMSVAACAWVLSLAGCSDAAHDAPDDAIGNDGRISFRLSLSDDGVPSGEDAYNENKFMFVDIFLYDEDAGDDDAALLHHHETLSSDAQSATASIPAGELEGLLPDAGRRFKVVAVANCSEVSGLDRSEMSLGRLRAIETKTETEAGMAFRAADAPEAFVMNSFARPVTVAVDGGGQGEKTYVIKFRRLAAKIRVALSVYESITDENGVEWTPDIDGMRLYISNGVGMSRLDGDMSGLTHSGDADGGRYYNISVSEDGDTGDGGFARALTYHDVNMLSGKKDTEYVYYNDIPYYTYPNGGESDGSHATWLTVTVPWKNGSGDIFASYYAVSVNDSGTIVPDSYYYIRASIGTLGSPQSDAPEWTAALYLRVTSWIIWENDVLLW